MTLFHGTCVSLGEYAALLRGPSGAGKSDLAYRFINMPNFEPAAEPQLISDDQVCTARKDGRIIVSPPKTIAGKIELRGVGILDVPYRPSATLVLVVDLRDPAAVPRLPDWKMRVDIADAEIPMIELTPFEVSAELKLGAAIKKSTELLGYC